MKKRIHFFMIGLSLINAILCCRYFYEFVIFAIVIGIFIWNVYAYLNHKKMLNIPMHSDDATKPENRQGIFILNVIFYVGFNIALVAQQFKS